MRNPRPFPYRREADVYTWLREAGNVITFLMEYENYTFQEALSPLADRPA